MTAIQTLLTRNGPMMSGRLAAELSETLNISKNAASQQITRSDEFARLGGFFKSNQSLYYLDKHVGDGSLAEAVVDSMYQQGRKYWFTINALKMHGGVISRRYLECYTNYPVEPLKKHIPFDEVLNRFIRSNILVYNSDEFMFSPRFSNRITNQLLHRSIELVKDNVLHHFHSLVRNTGMISYETGELFAEFGKFRWGIKGVSPIAGLRDKDNHGFLLGDVLLGRPFYQDDIRFFIEKLKHVQSFQRASRILPIMLVDNLDRHAMAYLKKYGVVIGFLKEFFGEKYADAIGQLLAILNNAGASLKTDPDKYLDLIRELKKYNDGLANNMRGTLFEYMVGHIHSIQCQSIDLGRQVIANRGRHEMDVFAVYGDKVVISECKALKSMVDEELVQKWLNEKIPAFRAWLLTQETLRDKAQVFEYWSTSGFTEGARQMLEDMNDAHRYKVDLFGPAEIRAKATEMKNKKLKESLDDYFLKPLV
jgi:hypothetical protein